jgi:hypothetical protein
MDIDRTPAVGIDTIPPLGEEISHLAPSVSGSPRRT